MSLPRLGGRGDKSGIDRLSYYPVRARGGANERAGG